MLLILWDGSFLVSEDFGLVGRDFLLVDASYWVSSKVSCVCVWGYAF
jgi:hypothetical protein